MPFAPARYEDPFFSGQTEALRFDAKGVEVDLRDVTISGAVEPNGGDIDQLTLSGTIDTRPLEELSSPDGQDLGHGSFRGRHVDFEGRPDLGNEAVNPSVRRLHVVG